jgi:hypothetical protein
MKKIAVILTILCINHVQAQIKEGFVKYNMTIEGDASKGFNPMTGNTGITIYFKNDKTLSEMSTSIYSMKTLVDKTGMVTLMDAMGQKFYIKKTLEELVKERNQKKTADPVIVYTKETKKILGYDCVKTFITVEGTKGTKLTMTGWHTNKIHTENAAMGLFDPAILSKFKGMLLEMEMSQGPIKTKMTVTEISTKPVPDSKFVLSTAGYIEKKSTVKPVK